MSAERLEIEEENEENDQHSNNQSINIPKSYNTTITPVVTPIKKKPSPKKHATRKRLKESEHLSVSLFDKNKNSIKEDESIILSIQKEDSLLSIKSQMSLKEENNSPIKKKKRSTQPSSQFFDSLSSLTQNNNDVDTNIKFKKEIKHQSKKKTITSSLASLSKAGGRDVLSLLK